MNNERDFCCDLPSSSNRAVLWGWPCVCFNCLMLRSFSGVVHADVLVLLQLCVLHSLFTILVPETWLASENELVSWASQMKS